MKIFKPVASSLLLFIVISVLLLLGLSFLLLLAQVTYNQTAILNQLPGQLASTRPYELPKLLVFILLTAIVMHINITT